MLDRTMDDFSNFLSCPEEEIGSQLEILVKVNAKHQSFAQQIKTEKARAIKNKAATKITKPLSIDTKTLTDFAPDQKLHTPKVNMKVPQAVNRVK